MKAWSKPVVLVALISSMTGCSGSGQTPDVGTASDDVVEVGATTTELKTSKNMRIAVVGAGASGLTAAHSLKKLGYTSVTVFEKEAKAGGKVLTYDVGGRKAELGAVWISPDYRATLELAHEFNVPTAPYTNVMVLKGEDGREYSFEQFLFSKYTPAQVMASLGAYMRLSAKYKINQTSGFVGLPAELNQNFADFAASQGITPLADLLKAFLIGCGYGYYETVPAMYYMKMMDWLVKIGPTGLALPALEILPNGFQDLWVQVANSLDVRLNSEVVQIERKLVGHGPKIKIWIKGQEEAEVFDRVIISAPPKQVMKMMNLTILEHVLFENTDSNRYFVSIAMAQGLKGGQSVFPYENTRPDRLGHVGVWGNRDPNSPLYMTYQIASRSQTPEQVTGLLAEDMMTYGGGTLLGIPLRKEWVEYFPHAQTGALNLGYYALLEAMQGRLGTYYVGGLMNFETVEHTARYAQDLVNKRFALPAD